jgi:NAD(P)-dependent dehydrogenase (short-subunit alcohol dehydrogenase family)
MSERLAVVTGATSGIGYETCRLLAQAGWRLLCVARDAKRGEAAVARFRSDGSPQVEFFACDLASVYQTAQLGARLAARAEPLDLLINNAGALFQRLEVTGEGCERTLALNHLAYFTLTQKLLPLLRMAPASRIVNVASRAHYGAVLDFDDLQMARDFSGWRQYQRSKLMNVLFTRELARRLADTSVATYCLHPGFVASRFGANNAWWFRALFRAAQLFAISPQQSARAVAQVATSAQCAAPSGAYFNLDQPGIASTAGQDDAAAERLWQVTADLVDSIFRGHGHRENSHTST